MSILSKIQMTNYIKNIFDWIDIFDLFFDLSEIR
jgi:hypothetical protein